MGESPMLLKPFKPTGRMPVLLRIGAAASRCRTRRGAPRPLEHMGKSPMPLKLFKPTGWQPVPRMGESPMSREPSKPTGRMPVILIRRVVFCVLDKRRLRGSVVTL